MLSKTHISIGLAASVTLLAPHTREAAVPVLVGGSIGSLLPDVDCKNNSNDALYGRMIVTIISAIAVLYDANTGESLTKSLLSMSVEKMIGIGICLVVVTVMWYSAHRGFSHSILALGMLTIGVVLISKELLPAFVIGYASHLLLDLTNKKKMSLFFPSKKRYCLGWFYSNRRANAVCMVLGCVWLIVALWWCGLINLEIG